MTEPRTLPELFFQAVERHDHPDFMRYKAGGEYVSIPAREFREEVELGAYGLISWGIEPGDRVALLSENRPAWGFADLSILCAGAWNVPIYFSLTAEEVEYILRDSGATACFVSTGEQLEKVEKVRGSCPDLRCVITLDPIERDDDAMCTARQLVERGQAERDRSPEALEKRLSAIEPDDTASILYTSGTTGKPKGVMLSHGNLVSNVIDSLKSLAITSTDSHLSFLPLSHSFERMAGYYVMIHTGVSIAYAEAIDKVADNMREIEPTVMTGVPRFYEKMYVRILESAKEAGGLKKWLVFWARRVAIDWAEAEVEGDGAGAWLASKRRIADRLVFSKLRERTGGRMRFFVSGGAPLAPVLAKFFYGAGLPILEGYGLTETSPVIAVNTLEAMKFGAVGRPIANVEVRIDEEIDAEAERPEGEGEILVRGPNVMQGYYKMPDKTREVLTDDGWFRTGDIGRLDDEGFLSITDRVKDLIKTSGGKFVAPQPLENELKTSKFVSQAVVVGNRRKYASVLIVPNFTNLEEWARDKGVSFEDREDLLEADAVQELFEGVLADVNEGRPSYETLKKFRLKAEEFSVEEGELTPGLEKVRRGVIEEKYADLIDTMYEEETVAA